ncbi:hypothetical protein V6Z11_A12G077900 [Gossypium hirsutum]
MQTLQRNLRYPQWLQISDTFKTRNVMKMIIFSPTRTKKENGWLQAIFHDTVDFN